MSDMKVGLVLSGGGAKGAYHVGVINALHELGAQVDAIAGASIGALNAAILASAGSLKEGGEHLESLWLELANTSPLHPNFPAYLQLLSAGGLQLVGLAVLQQHAARMLKLGHGVMPAWMEKRLHIYIDQLGVLSDSPLQRHMDQYLNFDKLNQGLPLHVSVYRQDSAILDLLRCVAAELGFVDSPPSEFIHIQSLPADQQKEALLASAAIPLLFSPKRINDTPYSDGGMGGWQKMQGNTPITPLLQSGCNMIIVTHLSDGSLWSRQDFPDATILEIRPQSNIAIGGVTPDILGFDPEKIPSWIKQGYEDTMHCVGRVMNATKARTELRESESALSRSLNSSRLIDRELEIAMRRIVKWTPDF